MLYYSTEYRHSILLLKHRYYSLQYRVQAQHSATKTQVYMYYTLQYRVQAQHPVTKAHVQNNCIFVIFRVVSLLCNFSHQVSFSSLVKKFQFCIKAKYSKTRFLRQCKKNVQPFCISLLKKIVTEPCYKNNFPYTIDLCHGYSLAIF